MNNKKSTKILLLGTMFIIFFVALILLFFNLFEIKYEEIKTEVDATIKPLNSKVVKKETEGEACNGNTYVEPTADNYGYRGIPKGYYCVNHGTHIYRNNYLSATEFKEYFGPGKT